MKLRFSPEEYIRYVPICLQGQKHTQKKEEKKVMLPALNLIACEKSGQCWISKASADADKSFVHRVAMITLSVVPMKDTLLSQQQCFRVYLWTYCCAEKHNYFADIEFYPWFDTVYIFGLYLRNKWDLLPMVLINQTYWEITKYYQHKVFCQHLIFARLKSLWHCILNYMIHTLILSVYQIKAKKM